MAAPHDVHGVDAFAQQLPPPFIRGAAPMPSTTTRDATIRLFGRDFSNDHHQETAAAPLLRKELAPTGDGLDAGGEAAAGDHQRKFECHYCCRNFPTSQALGGHQNAHKRERQHARRAHLEATFAAAHCGAAYLPHLYGIFGYASGGHAALPPPPPPHYHPAAMWAGTTAYGGVGPMPPRPPPPVYGAALPGMWRPSPAGSGAAGGLEGTEPMGYAEMVGKHDDKVAMSVVTTSLPPAMPSSCLVAGGQSTEMVGRSPELGHKDGAVLSLDLCL
ncbi:hypothetical protein HU200_000105 [Digitaria exilis]|uniref:C2H2-type domain-containing protein n=1 Tax=Digitaria exilis TaxID=1010633 RepID=A0A835KYQ2_9POAL|nr:hypothetical protein HU200_000105 [Digitaria exilis]CAB3469921.1 unnamed protein product [Digitaria exilis]